MTNRIFKRQDTGLDSEEAAVLDQVCEHGRMSQREIGKVVAKTPSSVSRHIESLVQKGEDRIAGHRICRCRPLFHPGVNVWVPVQTNRRQRQPQRAVDQAGEAVHGYWRGWRSSRLSGTRLARAPSTIRAAADSISGAK
ncbi:winged helix-turn-helix transcriptional regulator [Seongchinamella sediminis]|uniref:Winged helix-turn-helix transcriptional regulator n=1 Tax=Seongchinamella sediminis TaxID=2283635 RepID=A0A3L7DTF5_9GAMM|nr:winged helix-turn-helix transcriptional regulator [Seongchinamella sediminis]